MNNKKILLTSFIVLTFGIYTLAKQYISTGVEGNTQPNPITASTPTPANSTPTPSFTLTPTQTANGKFRDGTYTGDSVDAFYGNVQVKVSISGGKINNVQFLDYPKDRHTSVEINTQAMPQLTSEAIQVQNANVDIVSGATQTSRAFQQSLQTALTQAQS